jgi:hypothetical protein
VFDASEPAPGGASLLSLRPFRRGCGGRGFGVGRANELRIDLKMSSKGPASLVAPNKVKIDRQTRIVRSEDFIVVADTACILRKMPVLPQQFLGASFSAPVRGRRCPFYASAVVFLNSRSRACVDSIVSRGTRRRLLVRPSLDRLQISHLVGSHCHGFTPLR